eukprot:s435_g15.t1
MSIHLGQARDRSHVGLESDVSHRSWPFESQAAMDAAYQLLPRGCFAGLFGLLGGSSSQSSGSSWLLRSFCDEVFGGGASLGSLYAYLDLTEALLMLRPACRAIAAAAKGHPRLRSPLVVDVQDIEDLLSQMHFHWPKGVLIRQVVAGANPPEADFSFAVMLGVNVALLSGRTETVEVEKTSNVRNLKSLVKKSFETYFVKLVTAEGHVLADPGASLEAEGIENGDFLTAVPLQARLAANFAAFALWCQGGDHVVTWGDPEHGADSSAVQDQLRRVQQIQSSFGAFAAILADGSVVTWGDPTYGGDSSKVQGQLRNVQQIQATDSAFAAILADGSVVTWGSPSNGGDSTAVQHLLRDVEQLQATRNAFAAILADGSIVTWGYRLHCHSTEIQTQLKKVQQVAATGQAFAAILEAGSVVSWGHSEYGGDSSHVKTQLQNVKQIQATDSAFAAILENGSVVTWGDPTDGGDSSGVQNQLKSVQQVQGARFAFAAILQDGSVVSWGASNQGGDSSPVQHLLRNVQELQATPRQTAFAAILADRSVVMWGDRSGVREELRNARDIQGNGGAFAAILEDGSVTTWGNPERGGDSSAVQDQVTQLLCAAQSVSKELGAGQLQRLALPILGWTLGVPNPTLRMWVRLGLLSELRELHLLGRGGPSDAGLTYLARCCQKLQHLTLLGGSSSAASSLLLQAQSKGAMSDDWWRGFRCTRLCILPRLQHARLMLGCNGTRTRGF